MKESDILRECMIVASEMGAVVWRNNTGMLMDRNGTPVRYGLCNGSADIIGIHRGQFLAIECKTDKGRLSKAQEKFLKIVEQKGGIAIVARSGKDVKNFLNNVS